MKQDAINVSIIGAGSWGTALACLIVKNGHVAQLVTQTDEIADELASRRENRLFLPGVILPESLQITADIGQAVKKSDIILLAVPSDVIRIVCRSFAHIYCKTQAILCASKGLEQNTGLRLSQVIVQEIPDASDNIVSLSGPNLAVEIAAGVPAAAVVASMSVGSAEKCRVPLACPNYRIYTNTDIIGVEIGGALKNVIAIGAGICEGMGYGDNTKAALLTRGLAEMMRFGSALGAKHETFSGLAGIGDLIATSASKLSRNLRLGIALGKGEKLNDALEDIGQVAEGVPTTKAAFMMADKLKIDMPITSEIHAILFENRPPQEGLKNLMARSWKNEFH